MTDKKEKIIIAALELFSKLGFSATSTSKIARRACVSEGLIFRHFENKDGLLKAILLEGEERAKLVFSDIIFETDPKRVISKTLDLSKNMIGAKEDQEFWKLQYKIKWEIEAYGEHKMEPLKLALTSAFTKLGYKDPENEANILLLLMDGMATRYFLTKDYDMNAMIQFLRTKYNT